MENNMNLNNANKTAQTETNAPYAGIFSEPLYQTKAYPLKWHNFLIYFSLWIQGFSGILLGAIGLTVLGPDRPRRYYYNEELLAALVAVSIVLVICGVLTIVVRYRLKNLRDHAPGQLFILQLITALASTIFTMIDMDASFWTILSALPVIFLTRYYYKKRDDMFIY